MSDEISARLAQNLRQLRGARGCTQQQMSKLAGMPRATWANLESGASNPTLSVLQRVASALQVSIEELLSEARGPTRLHPKGSLPERRPGLVTVRKLLPDPIPGAALDRIELPPDARLTGVPHTAGTREYLTCELGEVVLLVSGERFTLSSGDVVSFRGDQKHSYLNLGSRTAVAYSVVIFAPRV
ncbi:MAG: helix-turn-helix transcriptional regulator [Myxococcales bacterium]|nr:helix-turn-helix transcriptional regulator [Myxococcales bacterium]